MSIANVTTVERSPIIVEDIPYKNTIQKQGNSDRHVTLISVTLWDAKNVINKSEQKI